MKRKNDFLKLSILLSISLLSCDLLSATNAIPKAGEVVINEFMASNTTYLANELGLYGDWVELYNTTGQTMDLSSMYLTDNFSKPTKSAFPAGTTIAPYGYLTIWADEATSTSTVIHAAFALSKSGEALMLSDGLGTVIDSITFGKQTDNVSMGRCPNGTGSFTFLTVPTFGTANECPVTSLEEGQTEILEVYPNPANQYVFITNNKNESILITNVMGKVMYKNRIKGNIDLNTQSWPEGLYIVRCGNNLQKLMIHH